MSALAALRERLNRYGSAVEEPGVLPLALPPIDDRLPRGGLALGRLHRIAGAGDDPAGAAATGFSARLLARLQKRGPVLWCAAADDLYPPALAALGLDPDRLVLVRPRDETGVLAVAEEALRTRGFGAVLAEAARAELLAERRLQLACEAHGTTAFLLQRRPVALRPGRTAASAAVTRWTVAPAPSGGATAWVGPARWELALTHSRGGRPGRWIVETEDGTDRLAVVAELADHAAAADHASRRLAG
ncbi:ImuA family protein [Inquilinus sp. Marseille-Q2685]|uniref:ImuA family protein n=1 Tax=Inquilinus sp. Marseille-Q2685 TaxID=2866581 RepID=UPI001CE3CDC0|nr:damage-inducible mutagenesis protein [Inquilinus sp. Marseille-Q2685]